MGTIRTYSDAGFLTDLPVPYVSEQLCSVQSFRRKRGQPGQGACVPSAHQLGKAAGLRGTLRTRRLYCKGKVFFCDWGVKITVLGNKSLPPKTDLEMPDTRESL